MASQRAYLLSASVLLALGAGGYWMYSNAVQGEGTLSQVPMNVQNKVTPAFIMAVDDSNSMTFERLFPGGDGRMQWNTANSSFLDGNGELYNIGDSCNNDGNDCYLFLYPHTKYNQYYSTGKAIPPIDSLGFARSPDINKSYFNPAVTYNPWKKSDGSRMAPAVAKDTRADPRTGGLFDTPNSVSYDLESGALRVSTSEFYRVRNGMIFPVGTIYRAGSGCGNASTNGAWIEVKNSDLTVSMGRGTTWCDMNFQYFPAVFYLTGAADGVQLPSDYGFDSSKIGTVKIQYADKKYLTLYKYEIKSGNFKSNYRKAIDNFANWFQFHRNRSLAMVGAMTEAMDTSVGNLRVGYFTINKRGDVTMRQTAEGYDADRVELYKSLTSLNPPNPSERIGGTPNRDAVAHLGAQFARTGGVEVPVQKACQKNGGMLFTDGSTNSNTGPTNIGNVDSDLGAPFADSYSNTIADIATKYYSGAGVPLRTDGEFKNLTGQVPVPEEACKASPADKRADCIRDLHMNFYGITLGAQGRIYGVDAAATADPYKTNPDWNSLGDPRTVDDGTTVDEIWHATINTHGDFINAKTPNDVTAAMRRVISSVGGGNTPSGSLGLTGARIGSNTFSVVPKYTSANNGTDWYSNLVASTVKYDMLSGKITLTEKWDAAPLLENGSAARSIRFSTSNGTLTPPVAAFVGTALGDDTQTYNRLCSGPLATCYDPEGKLNIRARLKNGANATATGAQMIEFLRGDRSQETAGGSGFFRKRTTLLGDIVNSSPVVSAPGDDYGYRSLVVDGAPDKFKYADYLTAKRNSKKDMVYVGANDGMLHSFHGDNGREVFGYIPAASLDHMGNLLFRYDVAYPSQVFDHRYYVDGPIAVSDVYDGSWKTALVATLGAGGRGAFALDVTAQDGLPKLLWEIDDKTTVTDSTGTKIGDRIGNVLGRPVIVPVMDGTQIKWKAVFGNGYGSVSGKAALFVVDMASGAVKVIPAVEAAGTAPVGKKNGLGNLVAVDNYVGSAVGTASVRGRDGLADTVYAADQTGNLWRFDLRDMSLAAGGKPLFTAKDKDGNRQPITGGLQVTSISGGSMIYFGTGSFSFVGDPDDKSMQSIYGIIDTDGTPIVGRSSLEQQFITSEANGLRDATRKSINSLKRGWFVDLVVDPSSSGSVASVGERFVGYPRLQNGTLYFVTYTPTVSSSATASCAIDGNNIEYGLNALSGAAELDQVRLGSADGTKLKTGTAGMRLNTGGTGVVNEIGLLTTGRASPLASGSSEADLQKALKNQCSIILQVPGADPQYLPRPCGRQSWRQLR
ncbi:pilus assembly protein [Lysobacter enzymogenes]|uniref:Pilus assembly protein n=1 Tax=Lysobacter enzymogenes TaxID=69 RepID=A0A3N2RIV7_LYSEN|nr:PilC/PilY family type IV pilus protein [Lysobacter enzymogenes]ROU07324.1 pilus assembly protein [Lysobacter enzymogenes]